MKEETPVAQIDADLEALIPGYLDNRRQELTLLKTALEEQDLEVFRRVGHTLKGSGYGFAPLNAMGQQMEEAANAAALGTLQELLKKLEWYVMEVRVEYVEL